MRAIRAYEGELSCALQDILEETSGITVYGLTHRHRLEERVPTVNFTLQGRRPRQVADALDRNNNYVGDYYTLAVTPCLCLEVSGSMENIPLKDVAYTAPGVSRPDDRRCGQLLP